MCLSNSWPHSIKELLLCNRNTANLFPTIFSHNKMSSSLKSLPGTNTSCKVATEILILSFQNTIGQPDMALSEMISKKQTNISLNMLSKNATHHFTFPICLRTTSRKNMLIWLSRCVFRVILDFEIALNNVKAFLCLICIITKLELLVYYWTVMGFKP